MASLAQRLSLAVLAISQLLSGVGCQPTSNVAPQDQAEGEPTSVAATGAETDSHQRMIQKLRDVDSFMKQHSAILSDGTLNQLTAKVVEAKSRGDLASFIALQVTIGQHHTNMGRGDEALVFLQQAISLLPVMRRSNMDYMPPSEESDLYVLAAIAAIRKAENENCVVCQDGQSCLFPISGKGIHEERAGSELATQFLRRALELNASNLRAIWFLNIAAMTLGEYPDSVPPQYRLPPERIHSSVPFPKFTNVAVDLGIDTMSLAGGAVVDDFDGDDLLDIIVSNWDTAGNLEFFRNLGDGKFERMTEPANLLGIVGGLNLNHADFDNDGDLDLFVMRGGWLGALGKVPNSLLQNDGNGVFRDVTFDVGLADQFFPTQTSAWADYDNDGDLDLYLGNEAFSNQLFENDDGHFRDVARAAGVDDASMTKGVTWGDVNGDGRPDLYVSNMAGDNRLYINHDDGKFTDIAAQAGVTKPRNGFPAWFWDFDNDGNLDLYASSFEQGIALVAADFLGIDSQQAAESRLGMDAHYRGDGRGGFANVSAALGLTAVTQPMGCNFGDLDNDGFLDFYLSTGYPEAEAMVPNLMYRNVKGERFVDVSEAGGFGHLQKGHGISFADLDHDGDQDVLAELGGWVAGDAFHNALFQNPGFNANWIKIELRGSQSNRFGFGAKIRLDITDDGVRRSIYRTVGYGSSFGGNPARQEIGIAAADSIDVVEIHWPTTGETQHFENVQANQTLRIVEGEGAVQVVDLTRARP
ncbi:FG-GAP repeat protein [Rubripirellula lacrimiformis]|uniref:FG-GAP repeat protein n=1 Tax=Rubripirellula lacrimiformis TaxID=1930273 RepID=A0A517NEX9_9BACT|nr:CRTAC1 family protein [Rubripirellula lacrimiformis]QDT05675.1 FG-GAP repeat protein [Rubripirellula lacrimiformis]